LKYSEIIGLNEYFHPVYDLENEKEAVWKQFIPNREFYKILSETIDSLESGTPKDRMSIWVQGTYGTGKSHATAVIKHILYDPWESIKDFVDGLDNIQVKSKVVQFRKNKRAFPVVIKGASSISNNKDFGFTVQKAVEQALKKEGISLGVESDFKSVISKLESKEFNWEVIFEGTELEIYGDKKDIIKKLKEYNVDVLTKIQNILYEKDIGIIISDLPQWLDEVRRELKKEGIADYLIIFWDEFTAILELEKTNPILSVFQGVAELSEKNGVFMFIVAHKRKYDTEALQAEIDKVLTRFKTLEYSMEPLTTYHIVSKAIKKKDPERFEHMKETYLVSIEDVIEKISRAEDRPIGNILADLFPIHPYTIYLSTFIARNMGSTNRSIFEFLYDEKMGFKKFIDTNPESGSVFLSPDALWDLFYSDFESSDNERIHAIVEKYK